MAMRMHLQEAVDGVIELDHDGANAWLGVMNCNANHRCKWIIIVMVYSLC